MDEPEPPKGRTSVLTTLRQALHLIGRDQRRRWMMLSVLALVASGFEMLGAILIYVLIGLVADPGSAIDLPLLGNVRTLAGNVDDRSLLLGLLAVMAVFFVLRGVVQVGTAYIQQRVAENAGARLSNKLVEGYLRLPYRTHLRRTSSELIRNGHGAVQQLVTQVFIPLIRVTAETFLTLAMLAVLVVLTPAATAIAVIVIGGVATLLLLLIQPKLKGLGATVHASAQETLASVQQALHGIRDIKILGRERYFARRYGKSRLAMARAKYLRSALAVLPHTSIELALIGFILLFFAITVAGGGSTQGALPILGLFAYVGLRLQPSLQAVIRGLNDLKFSAAPIEDLALDLRAVEALPVEKNQVGALPFLESIVFDAVRFRYEGSDVDALTDIDLTINHGEQIGICGPTGGGKTTLVDVLSGLLEPTEGRVTVDGRDLHDHARAWQRNLGVVPQMVFLVDDTLRRNIALGIPDSDIDEEALAEAVTLAQLDDFVAGLPKGLETTVGERGVRISGGERQRIAIARALYRRPAVLIFDEGTSALDNATEDHLMAAISRLRGRHTIILIAHRLSTVQSSDRVVLVDEGRIAAEGTFEALEQASDRFRTMAATRQSAQGQ